MEDDPMSEVDSITGRGHMASSHELAFLVALEASKEVADLWKMVLNEFTAQCDSASDHHQVDVDRIVCQTITTVRDTYHLQFDSHHFVPIWSFFNQCTKRFHNMVVTESKQKRYSYYDNYAHRSPVVGNDHSLFKRYISQQLSVLHLDGVFNGRAYHLPSCIFHLKNLEKLSLCDNQLRALPADIGRLVKLKTLILSNNRLKNDSIPFSISFCTELRTLLLDNNALDAIPGYILALKNLETLHRHGNQNYFRSTFMWYGMENRERIRTASFSDADVAAMALHCATQVQTLQFWAARATISLKKNYFLMPSLSETTRNYISSVYSMFNICDACNTASLLHAQGYFVFTFRNPYLGNTCVPFQHWTCSQECALYIEVPARLAQIRMAQKLGKKYDQEIRRHLRLYSQGIETIEEDPSPQTLLCAAGERKEKKSSHKKRRCKVM